MLEYGSHRSCTKELDPRNQRRKRTEQPINKETLVIIRGMERLHPPLPSRDACPQMWREIDGPTLSRPLLPQVSLHLTGTAMDFSDTHASFLSRRRSAAIPPAPMLRRHSSHAHAPPSPRHGLTALVSHPPVSKCSLAEAEPHDDGDIAASRKRRSQNQTTRRSFEATHLVLLWGGGAP